MFVVPLYFLTVNHSKTLLLPSPLLFSLPLNRSLAGLKIYLINYRRTVQTPLGPLLSLSVVIARADRQRAAEFKPTSSHLSQILGSRYGVKYKFESKKPLLNHTYFMTKRFHLRKYT